MTKLKIASDEIVPEMVADLFTPEKTGQVRLEQRETKEQWDAAIAEARAQPVTLNLRKLEQDDSRSSAAQALTKP